MLKTDILIIGGGFAGLSTAYHLAKTTKFSHLRGVRIVVIEQEKKLGGHASGRNAGMIRQALSDPVLTRLARDGRKALKRLGREWGDISLRANGSLLSAKGAEVAELEKIERAMKEERVACRWLSKEEAERRVPLLKGGHFEKALFSPTDAMVNIEALLGGFLKQLHRRRVPVLLGQKVRVIKRLKEGFLVQTQNKKIMARKIVNAAGAWAGIIGEKAGTTKIPLQAYRRHLYLSFPFRPFDKSWPFVWDVSHNFYFRPLKQSLLLSPCDKDRVSLRATAGSEAIYRAAIKRSRPRNDSSGVEKIDPHMRSVLLRKLGAFSHTFKGIKIQTVKSGLRTMTPDGRFVVGEDPKVRGFFWVAGLGGHGVTTCFSVGKLASDLILGRKSDEFLADALSPERFLDEAT